MHSSFTFFRLDTGLVLVEVLDELTEILVRSEARAQDHIYHEEQSFWLWPTLRHL